MAKSKTKSDFFTCIFQGFYCVIDFPISVENHINCWTNEIKPSTTKVKSSFLFYMDFIYTNAFAHPLAKYENCPSALSAVLTLEEQNWHYLFIHIV